MSFFEAMTHVGCCLFAIMVAAQRREMRLRYAQVKLHAKHRSPLAWRYNRYCIFEYYRICHCTSASELSQHGFMPRGMIKLREATLKK